MSGAAGRDFLDYVAVHIRQPALDPVVVVGQALVVETEEIEHRGVEIVNRAHVLDGAPA